MLWQRILAVNFRLVEADEFRDLVLAAGFRSVALYGDYAKRPFDAPTSAFMIWELVRNQGSSEP